MEKDGLSLSAYAADDFVDVLHPMCIQPCLHSFDDLHRHGRIHKIGSSYLDGGGSEHHELQRIFVIADAAKTDDGNLHCLCHLMHHTESNRLDART